LIVGTAFLAAATAEYASVQTPKTSDAKSLDRGRYLVKIADCNDCHTPGYMQAANKVPEYQWLTDDRPDWRAPCATTYPASRFLKLSPALPMAGRSG
jgi:mono/diheme cytochrome c family protein